MRPSRRLGLKVWGNCELRPEWNPRGWWELCPNYQSPSWCWWFEWCAIVFRYGHLYWQIHVVVFIKMWGAFEKVWKIRNLFTLSSVLLFQTPLLFPSLYGSPWLAFCCSQAYLRVLPCVCVNNMGIVYICVYVYQLG